MLTTNVINLKDMIEAKIEKLVDLSEDSINKIAEAVARKIEVGDLEIVRCKDCIHKPTGSGVNHDITFPEQDYRCPCRCEDYWYSWMPDDDWFCANGERREDETN